MKRRVLSGLWACLVAGSLVYVGMRVWRGAAVDTSLLSLLPTSEGDPLLKEANALLSQRASRMMGFVVGHADPTTVAEINQRLKEELLRSGFVRNSLTDIPAEQQKAFYDFYFPLRYQMLSPADRQRLQDKNPLDIFAGRLAGQLYSPASSFLTELIPKDPFLFFPELIRSWSISVFPEEITEEGVSYAFEAVELSVDPFDSKAQDQMMPWLVNLRKTFQTQWPGSHLHVTGALPFAMAERSRTEREMAMVSLGSFAGVLLLSLWVFSSMRVLILAALPITVGFVVAMAGTLLGFGNIHIITLAFGSSLIGVATDYPLLYLAYHRTAGAAWDPEKTLHEITPDLLLCAATTLVGYVALSFAPFPGLRQMALFSSVGLSAALITVVLWFPVLLRKGPRLLGEPRILSAGKAFLAAAHRVRRTGHRKNGVFALIVFLMFTIGGLARLRFDDDIRLLQKPSAAIAQEDAFVRKMMKGLGENHFILVRAGAVEELLQRQEDLQERLFALLSSGKIASVQSLAPFLPSLRRQQEERLLLQNVFLSQADSVRRRLSALGFPAGVANSFLKDLRQPLQAFSVEAWSASPASQMLRALWIGSTPHGFASAVLVGGLSDPAVLKETLKEVSGVRFFDQVEEYSHLFSRYRRLSMGLILLAYVGVWGLMILRYGPRRGTWVTVPSAGGVLLTFAFFGWFGIPVHLIHCLSALLVLSMGIDCSICYAESARAQRPLGPTLLSVELCAISTLLSFGLLALCQTPVLSAIGMTVFIGMAVAFLLSTLPALEATA
jgi:predicted exporter